VYTECGALVFKLEERGGTPESQGNPATVCPPPENTSGDSTNDSSTDNTGDSSTDNTGDSSTDTTGDCGCSQLLETIALVRE